MRTENAKKALEKDNSWTQRIAITASVKRRSFMVLIHEIRVAGVDTFNQSQAITKIYDQNTRLHSEIEITRLSWNKRTIKNGKRYGSLLLFTANMKVADAIINQGLLHEGELKNCERFISNARIYQCFQCQGYEHSGKSYKKSQACGHCSQNHDIKDCSNKTVETRKCALCKENHTA